MTGDLSVTLDETIAIVGNRRISRRTFRESASYHVSADLGRFPDGLRLRGEELAALMDDHDSRQVLHVTYGSALAVMAPRMRATLLAHTEEYAATFDEHFYGHFKPFIGASRMRS